MRSIETHPDRRTNVRIRRPLVCAVGLVTVLTLILSACGSSADSSSKPSGLASGADPAIAKLIPKEIKQKGYLNVASENYPTAVIIPEGGGAPQGYEPAIAKKLGKLMGLEFRIKIVPFDSIIPGLAAHRYDIAMGEIGIDDERRKTVLFVSDIAGTNSFLVKDGDGVNVNSLATACGLKIAALGGSQQLKALQGQDDSCKSQGKPIEIQIYNDQAAANLALQSGRAQAVMGDTSTLAYVTKQHPKEYLVQGEFLLANDKYKGQAGIAISPTPYATGLAKALAAALNVMINDGSFEAILKEWNGGHGMIPKAEVYGLLE